MPFLTWINDKDARNQAVNVPFHILKNAGTYGDPSAENLVVHGDNLLALRALLPFYRGKVKCIYIDPPYNTGSAFEHYDDNLEHSQWLSMMYCRLQLLREFLAEDGSIWVSIDDRESHYLKVIMDEIFGRPYFIGDVAWQRTYSTRNDSKGLCVEVEHIIAYGRSKSWQPLKLQRTAEMDAKYKNPDNDVARWTSGDAFASGGASHQGMVYAIQHPFTGEMIYPPPQQHWRYSQEALLDIFNSWCPYELKDIVDQDIRAQICGLDPSQVRAGVKAIVLVNDLEKSKEIASKVYKRGQWPIYYFTKGGYGGVRRKTYLNAVGGRMPTNFWPYEEVGHTDEAKKEIRKLFGADLFGTPKPERLIQRLLTIATNPGDLVLDSFLGSGTTAAVAHKMGRRYIGIEMGEHAKTHCIPRLQKVIDGEQGGISTSVNWQGGGGFRFFELGEPAFDKWGCINPEVDFKTLAAFVWMSETGEAAEPAESPFLGVSNGTAYYLLYAPEGSSNDPSAGVLTFATMQELLKNHPFDGPKVVFAEACAGLAEQELKAHQITFKQIPTDLLR